MISKNENEIKTNIQQTKRNRNIEALNENCIGTLRRFFGPPMLREHLWKGA